MPDIQNLQRPKTPAQSNIVITDDDVRVFEWLYHHRFLRSDQIAALWGRSQYRAERRLRALWQHCYLERPPDQMALWIRGDSTMVYGLSDRGARELARLRGRQGDDPQRIRWKTRAERASYRHIQHALMVSQLGVCLRLALRSHSDIFLQWREGRDAWDKLKICKRPDLNTDRVYLTPDALFLLKRSQWKQWRAYFVEADRGTVPLAKMEERYKIYHAYWKDQVSPKYRRQKNGFGIDRMRVLTITETSARSESLRDLFTKNQQFLFSHETWSLENPTAVLEAWYPPGHSKSVSLLS